MPASVEIDALFHGVTRMDLSFLSHYCQVVQVVNSYSYQLLFNTGYAARWVGGVGFTAFEQRGDDSLEGQCGPLVIGWLHPP